MVKEQKLNPRPFIATMLLTDGHMCLKKNCYEIGYASKNNYELNKIFIELVKLWNNEIVISEYIKNSGTIINYFHLPLQNELIKISPSYKKSPSKNQTSEEYLRSPQPSLKFLKRLNDIYKILCIRIALSNEGGISVTTKMNKNQIKLSSRLFLSCAHPKLNSEWKSILKDVGLNFNISKSKQTWSGVYGLYTAKKDNIKFFKELGGFIEGVKIKQNSKYYGGVEKNKLLKICLQNSKFKNMAEVKNMLGP